GPGRGELVRRRRPAAARLHADPGGQALPGDRARHLARLLRGGHRPAAARAAGGEPGMSPPAGPPRPEETRYAGGAAGPEELERYLAAVTARLPGSAKAHSGIVAELRSGLLDAADGYLAAGLPPAGAVQAAVREFGDPKLIAAGFGTEIAAR